MKPVRTSSQTNPLQKFRALGLTLLLSATMIVGLFLALVSPAKAREGNDVQREDVAPPIGATADRSAGSTMLHPEELEPPLLEQENYLVPDNSDRFFGHSMIERSSESEATIRCPPYRRCPPRAGGKFCASCQGGGGTSDSASHGRRTTSPPSHVLR